MGEKSIMSWETFVPDLFRSMSDADALWFWCDPIGDYVSMKIYNNGRPRWASQEDSLKVVKPPSQIPMKFDSMTRARL